MPWPESNIKRRGRPYVYHPTVILRCFVVRMWFRLDSNRALHDFLAMDYYPYNRKIMKACGLTCLPDRRTFDRRLTNISVDIKEKIAAMAVLFVKENFVDPYIVAIDSTLLRAKGHLWHKSSMIKGIVPRSGIDIHARWGFSHTKGWVFGYKLHITASTGSLIVPLSADFTQADVQDNQIYPTITSSLLQGVRYMAADSGYDDYKLYNMSITRGFELVCPVSEIYSHTSNDRLQLIEFYESKLGQIIYSWRGISIEPLIEHIKGVFKIDPLQVRGYQKAAGLVLLSVLLYQIIVYYYCKTRKEHPKAIKHMLGG
ncbi:MAG: transposase, partial [Nitrososphaeraceae archaeon]|nr:transposase [Nitrososphaeraceae archaeon]